MVPYLAKTCRCDHFCSLGRRKVSFVKQSIFNENTTFGLVMKSFISDTRIKVIKLRDIDIYLY